MKQQLMSTLVKRIGLGLGLSGLLAAIAACQTAPPSKTEPAPSSPATGAVPPPDTTTAAPPQNTAPAQPPVAVAPNTAPPAPTTSAEATPRPQPKPIPPIPPECATAQTQLEMTRCADAEFQQADAKLNNVYQEVKSQLNATQANQLVTAEEAWIAYRDTYCDFVKSQFEGGSLQPMAFSNCLTQITLDRINALQPGQTTGTRYDVADADLNAAYQTLQTLLSEPEKAALADAQLAWIEYRDRHCALAGGDQQCLASTTEAQVQQLKQQIESRSL